jgi:hypothetical protein
MCPSPVASLNALPTPKSMKTKVATDGYGG